jgi:hypothetical protein
MEAGGCMASKTGRAAKSATEALLILWEEGFFVAWKKWAAAEEALAKRGNHFSKAELGMALMRAKHLTRRGKKNHYEYIQKYPHKLESTPRLTKDEKARGR